jgi:uncharacterized protein
MKNDSNPFLPVGYRGPKYFCDRKQESKLLTQIMLDGINVTLFAIRRLGKTGLIHHVFYPYRKSKTIACIYLDILATNSLSDFTNQIATAVYNRFPPNHSLGKKIMKLFQRFRPVISFDELTNIPSLSLTIETKAQREQTIGNIFNFLDSQGIKVVFAIDEFQQVLHYPEKNTEAILRTYIQQLKNTSFIFCGSNQHMMHQIFNSAKRPFFASCTHMGLDYINPGEYQKFIRRKFKEHNRAITNDCLDFICTWTRLHTFYVQQLCYTLFAQNNVENKIDDVHKAALDILKLNENTFFQYRNLLTESQWNLLTAIAKEEQVTQPQSRKFIEKHRLGTPALVKRGVDALLKKELIFQNTGVEKTYYEVYDKFLMRWLQGK